MRIKAFDLQSYDTERVDPLRCSAEAGGSGKEAREQTTKKKVLRVRLCPLFPYRSSAASRVWKNTFSLRSFTQRETRSCSSRIFTELSASAKAELSAVTLNRNCVPAGFLFFFFSLYNKNTVEWWLVVSEICFYFCCLCIVV